MTLPPGQHRVEGFPRFGTHLAKPAPPIPADPAIGISGAVTEPFTISLDDLAGLPRAERTADFHCVAGWSATDLVWEGVPFEAFFHRVIESAVEPDLPISHVEFRGLDRYRSIVLVEDALQEDVLIAERLNGRPLSTDHGAPVRLVSPSQYGFMSTKHLCQIVLHTSRPAVSTRRPALLGHLPHLIRDHPRARVWQEERNPDLPNWLLRPVYRALIPGITYLSGRGSDER